MVTRGLPRRKFDGLDPPVFQAEQAVGQDLSFGQIVGDVQRGHPGLGADAGQQIAHLAAGFVVQGAERFVQAQNPRAERQRAAQRHALAFAAAEAARLAMQQVSDAQQFGQLANPLPD